MGEFELIRRYFAAQAGRDPSVAVGIGDDCAQLRVPAGQELVVSIDSMVEGTHFLPGTPADVVATRLLGAAASDLAAMGAQPAWLTLALTLPETDPHWLEAFSDALADCCRRFHLTLVGGDTTRGPLTLSAQVHGFVPAGQGLKRSDARPGDYICVTGTLGDSRAGLEQLLKGEQADDWLIERFNAPEPRLSTGLLIAPYASACADISDGILSDLGHIVHASGVGAELDSRLLPLSNALRQFAGAEQAVDWALSGGEDFELCFTVPQASWSALQEQLAWHAVPVTRVGQITEQALGYQLLDAHGQAQPAKQQGYDHFRHD